MYLSTKRFQKITCKRPELLSYHTMYHCFNVGSKWCSANMILTKIILLFTITTTYWIKRVFSKDFVEDPRADIKERGVPLTFPSFSSFGYIVAVAIPLDLPYNAYFSFTFEANYALPNNETHKDFVKKWDPDQYLPNNITSRDNEEKRNTKESPFSSRLIFYRTVAGYFQHFGYNGRACLLRTICEVADHEIEVYNGVYGSILHVLFMPSTSTHEGLSRDFYIAEKHGKRHSCDRYEEECQFSFVEFITDEFDVSHLHF